MGAKISTTKTTKTSTNQPETAKEKAKQNEEQKKFAKKLVAQGHICVLILESYPCKVSWCNKKRCSQK
jgi:hypothetical protein